MPTYLPADALEEFLFIIGAAVFIITTKVIPNCTDQTSKGLV
jgi:hypothetical protein